MGGVFICIVVFGFVGCGGFFGLRVCVGLGVFCFGVVLLFLFCVCRYCRCCVLMFCVLVLGCCGKCFVVVVVVLGVVC